MISFTLLTDTPARLRNQLIARDIIKSVTDPETGQQQLVGVREGVEFVEVPNIIQTSAAVGTPGQPGYVPAVMDTRHAYLVKIVRAAEGNETAGLQQSDTDAQGHQTPRSLLQRTKLGQWVLNNSTPDTLTSADGRSWAARNVNDNFWLTISDDFGVWQ